MIDTRAVAALWWREIIRFVRQRSRLVGAFAQPLVRDPGFAAERATERIGVEEAGGVANGEPIGMVRSAAIGAGIGIGQIGKGAVEAIARQPESSNDIRANMILTAALVEGAALFAIIVGFLAMVL